jgi:hypothetical protein
LLAYGDIAGPLRATGRRLVSAQSKVPGNHEYYHHEAHDPDNIVHLALTVADASFCPQCRFHVRKCGPVGETLPPRFFLLGQFPRHTAARLDAAGVVISLAEIASTRPFVSERRSRMLRKILIPSSGCVANIS